MLLNCDCSPSAFRFRHQAFWETKTTNSTACPFDRTFQGTLSRDEINYHTTSVSCRQLKLQEFICFFCWKSRFVHVTFQGCLSNLMDPLLTLDDKLMWPRCFKMFSWEMSALEIGYIFHTSLQRFWAIGISCNFSMQSSWGELGRPCLSWWTPPPQNISKEMSMYPCRKLDRNLELGYLPH